jgi:hypothetical protein
MEAGYTGITGRLEELLRAENVGLEKDLGVDDGPAVVRFGSEVNHPIWAVSLEKVARQVIVADVALDKEVATGPGELFFDITQAVLVPGIGEQVVIDHPVIGVGVKPVADEIRADEPGPTGDKHGRHERFSFPVYLIKHLSQIFIPLISLYRVSGSCQRSQSSETVFPSLRSCFRIDSQDFPSPLSPIPSITVHGGTVVPPETTVSPGTTVPISPPLPDCPIAQVPSRLLPNHPINQ